MEDRRGRGHRSIGRGEEQRGRSKEGGAKREEQRGRSKEGGAKREELGESLGLLLTCGVCLVRGGFASSSLRMGAT